MDPARNVILPTNTTAKPTTNTLKRSRLGEQREDVNQQKRVKDNSVFLQLKEKLKIVRKIFSGQRSVDLGRRLLTVGLEFSGL